MAPKSEPTARPDLHNACCTGPSAGLPCALRPPRPPGPIRASRGLFNESHDHCWDRANDCIPIPNSNSDGERKNKAEISTRAIVGPESPGRLPEAAWADGRSALPPSLMTLLRRKMAANSSFSREEPCRAGDSSAPRCCAWPHPRGILGQLQKFRALLHFHIRDLQGPRAMTQMAAELGVLLTPPRFHELSPVFQVRPPWGRPPPPPPACSNSSCG